jgi:enterobactin synthetase component D
VSAVGASSAYAPFLSGVEIRDLPEGPLLEAHFDAGALSLVDLPFSLPEALSRAVPKRRAEFVAGRLLAHLGQVHLGVTPQAIGVSKMRAPQWPPGLTGSLTHSSNRAAIWLSRSSDVSLGIDLEMRLQGNGLRAVRKRVLDVTELAVLGPDPMAATIAFSAKESLFKALYPRVQRSFGFDAARVVSLSANRLSLALTADLNPTLRADRRFDIAVERRDGAALTWLCVPTGAERVA